MAEYTVLDDYAPGDKVSHREVAESILPQLKDEMPEDEYAVDFHADIEKAVIQEILRDLEANLRGEDTFAVGFENPEDWLNADDVGDFIGDTAKRYFKNDQIGKSNAILDVILEYAEEYDLVEFNSE